MIVAAFIAGLGVGLSVGLAVALRMMAARDPAPRVSRPREPTGTDVARLGVR